MTNKKYPLLLILLLWLTTLAGQNSQPTINDLYPKRIGSLRLSTNTLALGKVRNNAVRTDSIKMYNAGSYPMKLSIGSKIPHYLQLKLGTALLEPGQSSWIEVQYDLAKRNDYGFVLDHFLLNTNDSVLTIKSINITAIIQHYFPPMSAADSLIIQKARINSASFDYGMLKAGDKSTHDFTIYNDGKSDLKIFKAKTSCGCLKVTFNKELISPGDSSIAHLEFDSYGKEGKDSRRMNLYLNDPAMPEIILEMKGVITKM